MTLSSMDPRNLNKRKKARILWVPFDGACHMPKICFYHIYNILLNFHSNNQNCISYPYFTEDEPKVQRDQVYPMLLLVTGYARI